MNDAKKIRIEALRAAIRSMGVGKGRTSADFVLLAEDYAKWLANGIIPQAVRDSASARGSQD